MDACALKINELLLLLVVIKDYESAFDPVTSIYISLINGFTDWLSTTC